MIHSFFSIDRPGGYDIRLISNIRGNAQSNKYFFTKIVDSESFGWMIIKNSGFISVNGEKTELRCVPGFFDFPPKEKQLIQVTATENARCRFAVIFVSLFNYRFFYQFV